jgi:hypothetical protein
LSRRSAAPRDQGMDPEKLTLWAVIVSFALAFAIVLILAV